MNHTNTTTTVLSKNLGPGEWIAVDVPTVHSGAGGLSTGRWPCRIMETQPCGDGQVRIAGLVTTKKATTMWQCVLPGDTEVETLPKHHAVCRKCRQLAPCHDELVTQTLIEAFTEGDDTEAAATNDDVEGE